MGDKLSSPNRTITRGAIFLCALSCLCVCLKAVNIIAWSWWLVLSPILILALAVILFWAIALWLGAHVQ